MTLRITPTRRPSDRFALLICVGALVIGSLLCHRSALAVERITSFDCRVVVGEEGMLSITETITVVAEASDGAEAVEEVVAVKPDVVLMDIALPDGWGGRVAQRLLAVRPDLAIVYTTGMVEIDPIESGGLTGSDAVLRKPFTGDQLVETLNNAMASKRGRS